MRTAGSSLRGEPRIGAVRLRAMGVTAARWRLRAPFGRPFRGAAAPGDARSRALAAILAGAAAIASASAFAEPWKPPPITAERVLERYETKTELSIFVGAKPKWCTPIFEKTEICTWTISKGEAGWKPLADTVPTEHAVNLVCEVPTTALGREPGSCTVHPRRSNRSDWKPPFSNARIEHTRRRRVENEKAAKERQRQATALLDSARTVMDLCRLVGRGPTTCTLPEGSLRWQCVWQADLETEGHGTLATVAGGAYDDSLRIECFLPADRSPRSLESCTVSVEG